jgi:hypothetical protein
VLAIHSLSSYKKTNGRNAATHKIINHQSAFINQIFFPPALSAWQNRGVNSTILSGRYSSPY